MPVTGAEGAGGGSPEWQAPTDLAPTSPGFEPLSVEGPFGDLAETAELTARLPEVIGGPIVEG